MARRACAFLGLRRILHIQSIKTYTADINWNERLVIAMTDRFIFLVPRTPVWRDAKRIVIVCGYEKPSKVVIK